jgi:hypothetical protein
MIFYSHILTHTYTYSHILTHTYSLTHTHTYIHIHTYTYTYIYIHTHTHLGLNELEVLRELLLGGLVLLGLDHGLQGRLANNQHATQRVGVDDGVVHAVVCMKCSV